ncbi:MAG TPA: hypothetical protein PLI11_04725 [Clostridia bacterium]|jgi:hypothetical protein|nr:hypothetical protein [Clostridiaceae bacterium]HPZ52201.1 hypothetical protein [Clostridia bacterium]
MSKKNIKVIITCLILVLIVILSSCDGTRKGSYIEAKDRLTGNDELRINIKLQKLYGGSKHLFLDDISAKELADYINKYDDENFNLSASVYQDKYVLITKADKNDEFLNYYMLFVRGMKTFFCPVAVLKNDNTDVEIYMPFHLLIDASNRLESELSVNGIMYKTVGTKKQFFDFYNTYERYDVEVLGDKFVVEDKVDGVKFEISFQYEKRPAQQNEFDLFVTFDISS